MSRKSAVVIIILAIVFIVVFDATMLFVQSGKLEKIIHSIQKFDSLYSQNFRMQQQLLLYSRKLNTNTISRNKLKAELEKLIPPSQIKVSGDTLSLKSEVEVNTLKLLNLLLSYTNVSVMDISFTSSIPVKYSGFSYSEVFSEKVILKKLIVKVYGG
ncbi:hypothetical protein [Mesoaciditoga lauensis]|uniref:hypothetical protein n=1 Tax=Mesoaciditoga lauensis TaxID=1495039 RepID=UPI00055D73D4|nr:hypothetical protein [Mesoaciditoga lauensis]